MHNRPIALVTGASSGFGMRASVALAKSGFHVIASMRDPNKREELIQLANAQLVLEHVEILALDVTRPDEIDQAVSGIVDRHGRIDMLLNNAGYASGGFVEEVASEEWRRQFEVNVFGLIDVTRAVIPYMRQKKHGRIINVSSISGRFGFPGLAPYCASKHAVEGFSESLRLELLPFDIHVVLIEPGSYRTSIWEKSIAQVRQHQHSAYQRQMQRMMEMVEQIQAEAPAPDEVVAAIVHAATSERPRFRYPVGRGVRFTIAAKQWLPWKWIERIVARKMS